MVSIGFPLWLGDKKRFAVKIREASEAGFDFMELSFDYPWPLPDNFTPKSIAKAIRDAGLNLAIHGSWRDIRFCLLYTSPSPRDLSTSRMPSSA